MQTTSPSIVAIGNFDGVHLGHQALLRAAGNIAARQGLTLKALTFEPHPRAFLAPDAAPGRLTSPALKEMLLAQLGAQPMTLPFDADLAGMEAERFISDILLGQLNARHVVIGENFTFGHKRGGNAALLQRVLGDENVTIVPPATDENGRPYSSSGVRVLLKMGEIATAASWLGRPYIIENGVKGVLWPADSLYEVFLSQNGVDWHSSTLEIDQNAPVELENDVRFVVFSREMPDFTL